MTVPSIALGFLIASLNGLVFHLIRGGRFIRLIAYFVTAWIAFFLGHWLGDRIGWRLWRVGTLNLAAALLFTWLGLIAANILMGPEPKPSPRRPPRRPQS